MEPADPARGQSHKAALCRFNLANGAYREDTLRHMLKRELVREGGPPSQLLLIFE